MTGTIVSRSAAGMVCVIVKSAREGKDDAPRLWHVMVGPNVTWGYAVWVAKLSSHIPRV